MLADSGYDVFIASYRGTSLNRGHTTLDASTDPDYWDFSYAEMGLYDDKALIEMAVSLNPNFDKAYYIGYSQGTI